MINDTPLCPVETTQRILKLPSVYMGLTHCVRGGAVTSPFTLVECHLLSMHSQK